MTKAEPPPLPSIRVSFFFPHTLWWWRHSLSILVRYCLRPWPTCVHMLASPSGSCSQPLARGRFPIMQWSGTVCDWPRSGGQLEVWLADAMHPGMLLKVWFSEANLAHTHTHRHTNTQAAIHLGLCSFVSSWIETFWPWFHAAVSWAITHRCSSVPELLFDH